MLIPEKGLSVHLRGYGWITVFKFEAKNGCINYVATNMKNPTCEQVKRITDARWSIEVLSSRNKANLWNGALLGTNQACIQQCLLLPCSFEAA